MANKEEQRQAFVDWRFWLVCAISFAAAWAIVHGTALEDTAWSLLVYGASGWLAGYVYYGVRGDDG